MQDSESMWVETSSCSGESQLRVVSCRSRDGWDKADAGVCDSFEGSRSERKLCRCELGR